MSFARVRSKSLDAHLALRREYVSVGKIHHEHLFFLKDGRPISGPEITRWRWSESIKALNIRRREPYHARHSSVTWQLMLGKNLLWVAKQHGHSVEVMLRMYAAWLDGTNHDQPRAICRRIYRGNCRTRIQKMQRAQLAFFPSPV